jgi:hypothetical protein
LGRAAQNNYATNNQLRTGFLRLFLQYIKRVRK